MTRMIGNLFIRYIFVSTVILAIIEIVSINRLAGEGKIVNAVDSNITTLRQQNDLLEERIASASSLMTIAVRSKEMGFIEPSKTQYIPIAPNELPVAIRNP